LTATAWAAPLQTQPHYLGAGSSTTTGGNDRGATCTDYDVLGRDAGLTGYEPNPVGESSPVPC
jgi:hypothetical protein